MSRAIPAAALALLAACTPSLNWREMTVESTGLHAMFPCKPDQVQNKVELSPGKPVVLHALGCEAGGATFAVLYGDLGDAPQLADALAQWKKASIANTKSTDAREEAWRPPGSVGLAQSDLVRATGQAPDGKPLQMHAAYFARGSNIFQAVVYSRQVKADMSEPFFAGLRFE